jgi:SET domain-containing protein
MAAELKSSSIVVKPSLIHGYGVFARKTIRKGSVIEECPMLETTGYDIADLQNYFFRLSEKTSGIALGFGCIYNHSPDPNASFSLDKKNMLMIVKAQRTIQAGEEIFISYGPEWFSDREIPLKEISPGRKLYRFLLGIPLRGTLAFLAVLLLTKYLQISP